MCVVVYSFLKAILRTWRVKKIATKMKMMHTTEEGRKIFGTKIFMAKRRKQRMLMRTKRIIVTKNLVMMIRTALHDNCFKVSMSTW